jgi:MYXO-CTERM domain-containing protein
MKANTLRPIFRALLIPVAFVPALATAASINVNLTPVAGDGIDVDADEFAVSGIVGAETVAGTGWNNIRTRPAGSSGDPTVFRAQTQGGNHIDLIGSDGADSGVDLTSAGAFFFNFSQVSNPSQAVTGDGGMMQSYLLANASETISLSGLAAWAPDGYRVIAFFDIGDQGPRVYGLTGTDGITTRSFFTNDSDSNSGGGVDTDADNDGVIEWKLTTATNAGAAVADANYADFGTFTGDTFTLSGADATRAVISGFQIVAVPEPSTIGFAALALAGLVARRRR